MEKLFINEEDYDLRKLEEIINAEVIDDIENKEDDVNTDKWGIFPVIYLENLEVLNLFKEFVFYVDELDKTRLEKISLILTLIYLMEKVKYDIKAVDINNLYLLVYYLDKENIKDLNLKVNIVNDNELLYKVRCFSLDIDVRGKLLNYVIKNDLNKDQLIDLITNNSYYQILNIIK